jgi:hypothetical protein
MLTNLIHSCSRVQSLFVWNSFLQVIKDSVRPIRPSRSRWQSQFANGEVIEQAGFTEVQSFAKNA